MRKTAFLSPFYTKRKLIIITTILYLSNNPSDNKSTHCLKCSLFMHYKFDYAQNASSVF